MEKAKIKASTLTKIFNFLEKKKGEELPSILKKYLTGELKLEIAKENLSVTTFNNGEPIPEAKTPKEWLKLEEKKTPAFMRNGNDFHYNHFAVSDERGICPPGWRVPTREDLVFILHRNLYKNFTKSGYRNVYNGAVNLAGSDGFYWSSTVDQSFASSLYFGSNNAYVNNVYRAYGHSVRCVRDK